jgi:pimeloyl-ACP methyl ester carboxylesterase
MLRAGLALYAVGQGRPVLLMPSPHGFTAGPAAFGPLAQTLQRLGRQVVVFDPPGAYASSRPARIEMPEMTAAASETLEALRIQSPVDVVGHSMSGLCALAFALERPDDVRRLVLVGAFRAGQYCSGPGRCPAIGS